TILIRILQNVLGIISILIILGIWADVKNATILIITLTAALIGFSFKNLFSNIVGWFMLLRKKYFKLYDRIEISDIVGDVIKLHQSILKFWKEEIVYPLVLLQVV